MDVVRSPSRNALAGRGTHNCLRQGCEPWRSSTHRVQNGAPKFSTEFHTWASDHGVQQGKSHPPGLESIGVHRSRARGLGVRAMSLSRDRPTEASWALWKVAAAMNREVGQAPLGLAALFGRRWRAWFSKERRRKGLRARMSRPRVIQGAAGGTHLPVAIAYCWRAVDSTAFTVSAAWIQDSISLCCSCGACDALLLADGSWLSACEHDARQTQGGAGARGIQMSVCFARHQGTCINEG